jgi:hypothetical protein
LRIAELIIGVPSTSKTSLLSNRSAGRRNPEREDERKMLRSFLDEQTEISIICRTT